jgi:phosphoadenosine phosphosulfate reductase
MNFDQKIQVAIDRMKIHQPADGYYLAFSGGKDSCALKKLAEMGGIKFDAHYSVTTIDPPELVRFIKEQHKDVIWDRPVKPFLKEFVYRGAPRRRARWCCAVYKEGGGEGRSVLTGIRWAESFRRKTGRKLFEVCYKNAGKKTLNPIIDWTERDVWLFIGKTNTPYCSLYDEGRSRLGCLFCPMAKQRARDADVLRYPNFVKAFQRAFIDLYADRKVRDTAGIRNYADGMEFWDWWISGLSTKEWCKGKGKPYILKSEWKKEKSK